VAIGDPGQLGSVQAGGWLGAIANDQTGAALREAVRQLDSSERDALAALRDGDPSTYLGRKHGEVTVHQHEAAAVAELVDEWTGARLHYGPCGAVMIARDNYTRALANRAARAQLKRDGTLPTAGVLIGGREYTCGDRVVARRNHRRHDLDNGTLGTIVNVDGQSGAMLIETDTGELRVVDAAYAAKHLEHAYALTAHSAQGGTFEWAGVIGRPEEFTREWAYTALSRARRQTTLHVVMELPAREQEREDYAPRAPERDLAAGRQAVANAMKRTETELLAIEVLGASASDPQRQRAPSPPTPPPETNRDPVLTRPSRLRNFDGLRAGNRARPGARLTL
jgi:ATP-dependent exoDNAse (exonuclease V) alpha subunit